MAAFVNGSGGTLQGITTLEDWTVALINFLRIQQGNSARNPNSIRNLVITANTEGAISGSFTCPVMVAGGAAGAAVITATSYLTGVVYTPPSGGDSSAPNEVQALIDAVRRQRNLELSAANTTNANYLTWALSMGSTGVANTNGTISIGFNGLPVDMTQAANGSINIEGRTYLS